MKGVYNIVPSIYNNKNREPGLEIPSTSNAVLREILRKLKGSETAKQYKTNPPRRGTSGK